VRDAQLLAGTLFDLLAREEGDAAAVALGPRAARAQRAADARGRVPRTPVRPHRGAWRAGLERVRGLERDARRAVLGAKVSRTRPLRLAPPSVIRDLDGVEDGRAVRGRGRAAEDARIARVQAAAAAADMT
jgi:hypothetical protein